MTSLERLDWDDEEEATRQTPPPSCARAAESSAAIALFSLAGEPTDPEIELAPPTLVDLVPDTVASSSDEAWFEPPGTLRTPVLPAPASAIVDAGSRRRPPPPPVRRPKPVAATTACEPDAPLCQSAALPLIRPPRDPGLEPLPSGWLASVPPTVLSARPPEPSGEVRALRRRLGVSSAIGAVAVAGCVVLGALLIRPDPGRPAAFVAAQASTGLWAPVASRAAAAVAAAPGASAATPLNPCARPAQPRD